MGKFLHQSLPIIQDTSSIGNNFRYGITSDANIKISLVDVIGSLKIYARAINGLDDDVRLTNRLVYSTK